MQRDDCGPVHLSLGDGGNIEKYVAGLGSEEEGADSTCRRSCRRMPLVAIIHTFLVGLLKQPPLLRRQLFPAPPSRLNAVFADTPGHCPPIFDHGPSYQPEFCPQNVYNGSYCSLMQPAWSAFR